MTSAEQIYKLALEELASAGNEQAKLALAIALKLPSEDIARLKEDITRELRAANIELQRALGENDIKWTRATDRRINDAQNYLFLAISRLAK